MRCKERQYFDGTLSASRAKYPKSWILKANTSSTVSVTLDMEAIKEVEHFTYLGSVVNIHGEPEVYV